jgi:hypothetical protein
VALLTAFQDKEILVGLWAVAVKEGGVDGAPDVVVAVTQEVNGEEPAELTARILKR